MLDDIKVFCQNSIRIKSPQGLIYIDPFQMKEEPNDAAFVFLTHDHYDHFSPDDIKKVVGKNAVLVIPEKLEKRAAEVSGMFKKVVTVKPDISTEVDGLKFETVPAYNLIRPFHPKSSEWVGYIFKIDGKRIYVAGDTDATKEAKNVKCDIALVPIGGTFTMDAKKAAEFINEIKPEIAIPVHYGTAVGKISDGDDFAKRVDAPVKVLFKIEF
ncbi:MAG: MBL fold metallo-hydrolase [Eubacterium sp.]|nr:MBL fold metallo-hydrolase [Eubacterium sp.]